MAEEPATPADTELRDSQGADTSREGSWSPHEYLIEQPLHVKQHQGDEASVAADSALPTAETAMCTAPALMEYEGDRQSKRARASELDWSPALPQGKDEASATAHKTNSEHLGSESPDDVEKSSTPGRTDTELDRNSTLVSNADHAREPLERRPGGDYDERDACATTAMTTGAAPQDPGDECNGDSDAASTVDTELLFETPLAILKKFLDGHWVDAGRGPVRILRLRRCSESSGNTETFLRMDSGLRPVLYLRLEHETARTARWEKVRERSIRFLCPVSGQGPVMCVLQLRNAATADKLLALIEQVAFAAANKAPVASYTERSTGVQYSSSFSELWTRFQADTVPVLEQYREKALDDDETATAPRVVRLEQLIDASRKTLELQDAAQERLLQLLEEARETYTRTERELQTVHQRLCRRIAAVEPQLSKLRSSLGPVDSPAPLTSDPAKALSNNDLMITSVETRAAEASAYADPADFLGFCARLCSFRPSCFKQMRLEEKGAQGTGYPLVIELALGGWTYLLSGALHCGRCGATSAVSELVNESESSAQGCRHQPGCPWLSERSPTTFASFRADSSTSRTEACWALHLADAVRYLRDALERSASPNASVTERVAFRKLASHGWVCQTRQERLLFSCMFCGTPRFMAQGEIERSLDSTAAAGHHRRYCAFADTTVAVDIEQQLRNGTSAA